MHRRFVKNEFFHNEINKHLVVSSDCETWYFICDLNSPDLLPLAFLKLAIEMFSSKNNPLCEHEIL